MRLLCPGSSSLLARSTFIDDWAGRKSSYLLWAVLLELVCPIQDQLSIHANCLALFVQMGAALPKGGPAGLFLGFVIYGTIILSVNQCFG